MAIADEDKVYFDFCHDLIGSESEQRRHVMLRFAFVYQLRRDPKVLEFFRSITKQSRLDDCLSKAIDETERVGRLLGVTRGDIFRGMDWKSRVMAMTEVDQKAVADAVHSASAAVKKFDLQLVGEARNVGQSILTFVTEDLELPWPWLCMEMLFIFNCELVSCLCGHKIEIVPVFDPPSPAIDGRFRFAGGSKAEAFRKLDAFYKATRDEISGSGGRRCRRPEARKMVRYAIWFYRYRVKGETIRSLAREYHERNHPQKVQCQGDRSTIQYGIDECSRILGLTRFIFRNVPAPCRN